MGTIRILITGGAGYIGSVLTDVLLSSGYDVTVLDNLMYNQPGPLHLAHFPGFTFVRGDARDERVLQPLLKTHDVILPLAAIVGASACDRSPKLARTTNYEATILLSRLRSLSQLIVYPCTNSGYGTAEGICTEDTPFKPLSHYAYTKIEAETALLTQPNTISLRLATAFGVSSRMRWDLLVNSFVWEALTSKYLAVFQKDFKRNFVHVQDVACGFLHAIEHAQSMVGKPYNLGLDSANLTKEELAFKVKEHIPTCYVDLVEQGTDPDQRNYTVSSERLHKTGFEAAIDLDEGIRHLITAFHMTVHKTGNDRD